MTHPTREDWEKLDKLFRSLNPNESDTSRESRYRFGKFTELEIHEYGHMMAQVKLRADACSKCGHEVKKRELFNGTFVGCMC